MAFFGNRLKYVTCKTWDATKNNFKFLETVDPLYKKELELKKDVGIAFSGGGTRSACHPGSFTRIE